jgi:hypothetical protein
MYPASLSLHCWASDIPLRVFLAARVERAAILSDGDALLLCTTRATTYERDMRHDRLQVNASFCQGGNMHEVASSICIFGRSPTQS